MAPFTQTLLALLVAVSILIQLSCTEAYRIKIDSEDRYLGCGGMYESSPASNDSEIRVVMSGSSKGNAVVVAFEWGDYKYVGKKDADGRYIYICDTIALKAEACTEADIGKAIIDTSVESTVRSVAFDFTDEEETGIQYLEYPVRKTGYYCVMVWPVQVDGQVTSFTGTLEFNNKYGFLAGVDFPKLAFYGVLSLVYMTIGICWMILCAKHWREILMVQHFISGVIFFLMIEMAFNWGYWDNYNKSDAPSTPLLVITSILNSGRNSLSLFMLLIVSMGYGVVKPTLGSTMKKVVFLSLAHFLFGIIYSAGIMSPVEDVSAMIVLMVVVPLALTMTSFYIWTLQSLTSTIATLNMRRQTEKVKMYTRLWRLLVFSLTILCAFFVINTLNYMNIDDPDWPATHWRIKWFLLDGWLNILYLIVFTVIVILWRPTANNKRYGIDQLETEDFDEEHGDHNNARAAESMGLTGMKLRPQRRDYEMEDDGVVFDIGDDDEEDDDDDDNRDDGDELIPGRPAPQRSNSGSSPRNGQFTDESDRARFEASKMN